jgi:predicted nuclease of predicted toxin-antitoxin system
VKFLIDAQLPRRLARWLDEHGLDALHTLDLPRANSSTDEEVIEWAEREGRIVVTKDSDFVQSHILRSRPRRLWLISAGNMSNAVLESLVDGHWSSIQEALDSSCFVELSALGLIRHD